MEKRTYTVYKYDELPEEAQTKVLENLCDINVDHDWWEFTSEDNAIELKEFDIYRGDIEIDFAKSAQDTAAYILANHGEKCDTYITSAFYKDQDDDLKKKYDKLEKEYQSTDNDVRIQEIETLQNDIDEERSELAKEYREELEQDVLWNLRKEYDYLTSEEAIIQTIHANDYDFTLNGKID